MSKINEINKKLIKVLEEKIQLLEEQKAINEKIIEIQKEQLFLCGVGKQLNVLKEIDLIIQQLPKLKVLYNGHISYDGTNYMSIDELINKLKSE